MRSLQISVSLKPAIVEWLEAMAAKKQMSRSEYVARILENKMDDDYVVTREELDHRSREIDEGVKNGAIKTFNNVEDCLSDLYETAEKINTVR